MNKNKYSLVYYVVIFVVVQILLLAIVGLWILRYVANNMVMEKLGEQYSIQVPYQGSVPILIIGLGLIILVIIGMSLLFRHLSLQFKRTKMYDNFIANVTHELKTPLASIQLYVDTISKRDLSKEQVSTFIDRIKAESERLDKLVSKILDIARIDQKEMQYDCKTYKCSNLLHNIFNKLQKEYEETNIKIDFDLEDEKCLVDRESIGRVLRNLIDNSIKYSQGETNIDINVYSENGKLNMIFSDDGIGIPEGEKKKIFDKFYRINDNRNNVKGSGLGLYYVKEVIKFHGGKIEAQPFEDDRDKQGLTFLIQIPFKEKLGTYRRRKLTD